MDLSTVAARVARALRTIGHLLSEGDKAEIGNFLLDSADELDEANHAEESVRSKPPAAPKPEHKK